MSIDYYFACPKCQSCIHVAQDGLSGFSFYSKEPDCMAELGKWLETHSLCDERVILLSEYDVEDMAEHEWTPKHILDRIQSSPINDNKIPIGE